MGTNRNLLSAAREGRFRQDSLARIDLWTFTLPGLRSHARDRDDSDGWQLKSRCRSEMQQVHQKAREARADKRAKYRNTSIAPIGASLTCNR